MTEKTIYCAGCNSFVPARLTNGREIYPHRKDLHRLPFWKCDECGNYVGCHHKTKNRTAPLGIIPTPELRAARGHIHKILDPLWKGKKINRNDLYHMMADRLGIHEYHTAEITSVEDARKAWKAASEIQAELRK